MGTVIKTKTAMKTNSLASLTVLILSPFTLYNPANAVNGGNAGIRMLGRLIEIACQGPPRRPTFAAIAPQSGTGAGILQA